MWLYIVIGILLLLVIAAFCAVGVIFFGALHRTKSKKRKGGGIDTSVLFPALDAYRDVIDEGRAWYLSQPRRSVQITSDDGLKLHAEILEAENPVGVVMLVHGYRSSGAHDFSTVFRFYHENGFHIVVPDARACGKSEGNYITLGVKERYDCKRWAEFTVRTYPDLPILLDGISMGAATVLMATALDLPENVRGVIADCGFTSPWDIMRSVLKATGSLPVFPFAYIAKLYSRVFAGFGLCEASTVDAMKTCKLPVFFAHGKADIFVPYEMSVRAYKACASDKEFFSVDEAGHGMCYLLQKEEYEKRIAAFLDKHFSIKISV